MNRLRKIVFTTLLTLLLVTIKLHASEIHDAAAAGDLNKIRALLEVDSSLLESRDEHGDTPLIKACLGVPPSYISQIEVADFLIDQGADVNAKGDGGRTPLQCAVLTEPEACFDLLQRLIAKGADVNATMSNRNWTALVGIVGTGSTKVARLLIDHGADIDVRDMEGTPLQKSINNNRPISDNVAVDRELNEGMAMFLVERGARLQEFSFGNTELHLAAMRGFADLVRVLVSHGADVNAANNYGHTPLYYAARHGHRGAAEALIALGANESAIGETNYGRAPQLAESIGEGEAYLWYMASRISPNIGYVVKTREHLLIFNPSRIDESSEAGLANGYLNPKELAGQNITVLANYQPPPRYRADLSELARTLPGANFVLSAQPTVEEGNAPLPAVRLAKANQDLSVGGVWVVTISACQRLFGIEGFAYLVEVDGLKIFHAGLHASGNNPGEVEKYRREVDFLKPFGPIDIAILPIQGRHLESLNYESYLYLIDELSPRAIYLIGEELVTEELRKCLEVLRRRNVPVEYPKGGIAIGERFHYVRE